MKVSFLVLYSERVGISMTIAPKVSYVLLFDGSVEYSLSQTCALIDVICKPIIG